MSEESNDSGTEDNSVPSDATDAVDTGGGISLTGDPTGSNPLEGWRDGLSDDIKNDPSLASFKDVEGLAKSYVHSQKMIGTEKMPTPREDWDEASWNAFYEKAGRPANAEEYADPSVELPEGINLDSDTINTFKDKFHELGLSSKQASGLMDYYFNDVVKNHETMQDNNSKTLEEATQTLRNDFGRDFDLNIELARGALRKFGDDNLISMLEESGLGNNPDLIKAFANVGRMVSEDDARGGNSSLQLNGSANAQSELQNLKMDGDFQSKLMDRNAVGHNEALERWQSLHNMAYAEESA